MSVKSLLIKIDRFCAWFLIAIMVVFFVSGYGMTKGIISADFSKYLHETLLPIPGVIAFAFHSAYGMHIAFKRWKVWGPFLKTTLIIYGLAMVVGIVIFEFFIKMPGSNLQPPSSIEL